MLHSRLRVLVISSSLCVAGAPALLAAQGSTPRSYTVKRGDTLWDIAQALLGDAYQWPEIYRLNTGTIENPHWIYPGQELRLPGAGAGDAATAPASRASTPASAPASAPVPMAVAAPTATARAQGTSRAAGVTGSTVFWPRASTPGGPSRDALILRARATAVRAGEYLASPYMWSVGGPKDAGRVGLTAETQGIDFTIENRPLQLREPIFVRLPRDARGQPGEQLLVFRLGAVVNGQGQVVIPTGIVRLISAPRDGMAQGTVMQQFEDVYTGQGVTILDTLNMPHGVFPHVVDAGPTTRVSWRYNDPVLPTTGHYLILAATAKEGLQPGDQLSLRGEHHAERTGSLRGEEEVAVAQVTRVTLWGASAIILSQQQVGIVDGMRATVTAKMP